MKFSLVKKTIGISAALLISGQASAALITNWDWTLDSAWTASTPELNGSVVTGTGAVDVNGTAGFSTLSWGNDIGNGQSSLVVENPNLDTSNASAVAFNLMETGAGTGVFTDTQLGTLFTHNNIVIGLPGITAMTLTDYFTLTGAGAPAASVITNPDFDWAFTETPNIEGNCFIGDSLPTPCSDILVLKNPAPLQVSFQEDGYNYSLLVGAVGLGPLPAGACAAAGEGFPCIGIITEEDASSPFQFFITLTASKIPEPSALALMGLGLLGFGFSRRQKRK